MRAISLSDVAYEPPSQKPSNSSSGWETPVFVVLRRRNPLYVGPESLQEITISVSSAVVSTLAEGRLAGSRMSTKKVIVEPVGLNGILGGESVVMSEVTVFPVLSLLVTGTRRRNPLACNRLGPVSLGESSMYDSSEDRDDAAAEDGGGYNL